MSHIDNLNDQSTKLFKNLSIGVDRVLLVVNPIMGAFLIYSGFTQLIDRNITFRNYTDN